jgi:hypothetical protein
LALLLISVQTSDFFSLISFWTVKVPIPIYQAIIQWWWLMTNEAQLQFASVSNVSFSVSSKDDRVMKIIIIVDDDEYVSRKRNVYIRINYMRTIFCRSWLHEFIAKGFLDDFLDEEIYLFWIRILLRFLVSIYFLMRKIGRIKYDSVL